MPCGLYVARDAKASHACGTDAADVFGVVRVIENARQEAALVARAALRREVDTACARQ